MEREDEILDLEPFTHEHFDNIHPATFGNTVSLSKYENSSTMFDNELYWQFLYNSSGITAG